MATTAVQGAGKGEGRGGGGEGEGGRGGGKRTDLELCLVPVIDLLPHWLLRAEAFPKPAEQDPTVEAGLKLGHRGEGRCQDDLHPPGEWNKVQ